MLELIPGRVTSCSRSPSSQAARCPKCCLSGADTGLRISTSTREIASPAETGGFEPPREFYPPNRLAGGCFRPLSHVSGNDSTGAANGYAPRVPDVVVVGGGIVGVACANELALRGAWVTLLEKDELAAGASGRNLGYLDTSKDPVLAPLARRSLDRYLEITADPPTPVFIDREPLGTLAVTIDEDEVGDLRVWVESARAVG